MENNKYFISSSLRRRYNYLIGTLKPEQIYTPYVGKEGFNTISLKDYRQKETLIKSLDLIDLDKIYNSEDILVSVVMPTYNQEKFIISAIESILNQKHKNFELIIVNDGSTDNTSKIIWEYKTKDNRIKIIEKENGGTGSAINAGLREVNGEYSTWVSSDNVYNDNFLEELVDVLEYNIDCEYAFSGFNWKNLASNVSYFIHGFSGDEIPEGKYNKKNLVKSYDVGMCFLYRTKILNRLYFYDTNQAEDYLFAVKSALIGCDFYTIKKSLGTYNDYSDTLSRRKPEETHKTEIIARELAKKIV